MNVARRSIWLAAARRFSHDSITIEVSFTTQKRDWNVNTIVHRRIQETLNSDWTVTLLRDSIINAN